MKRIRRSVLLGILGLLASVTISYAQSTVDPDTGRPAARDRAVDEP
jgi:hypothetical protein